MTSSGELPEPGVESARASIPKPVNDWLSQFVKHLELHIIDTSCNLPLDASLSDYHRAAMRAVFQTFLDSSSEMDDDAVAEIVGQILFERSRSSTQWNSDLNQRRFELIDKEIQSIITPAEQIELSGLTRIMREHVETEDDLPLTGVKSLHRKLLDLE